MAEYATMLQECVCIYLEKTLEGSFSVDFNATINTQTEHTRVFIFSITSMFNPKDRPTLQKVRISEQCRQKRWVGYAYFLQ